MEARQVAPVVAAVQAQVGAVRPHRVRERHVLPIRLVGRRAFQHRHPRPGPGTGQRSGDSTNTPTGNQHFVRHSNDCAVATMYCRPPSPTFAIH